MHQKMYALEILKKNRSKMEHYNISITPTELRLQQSNNEHEQDVNLTKYQRQIGSLCYLCNTRPDLYFSARIVSKFMERPKVSHLATVKRIIICIKGSIGWGILFRTMDKSRKCNFLRYIDSN